MNETKIAVIGCGKQAPKHISGLRNIPGVKLVLADIDESVAKALAEKEGLAWVPNVDSVFSDETSRRYLYANIPSC
jgi:predicted dehydrogenase